MRILPNALALGLAFLGQPSLAQSNDDLVALRRCAAIEDQASRHACYDQVLRINDETEPVEDSDDAELSVAPGERALPALAAVPDPLTATETGSEAELAREDFGREAKKKNDPKLIDVTLVEATINARGRYVFRTEDGQLWRQTDTSDPHFHGFPVIARIRKGFLGTYFIKVKGVAGAVRVRRIN